MQFKWLLVVYLTSQKLGYAQKVTSIPAGTLIDLALKFLKAEGITG